MESIKWQFKIGKLYINKGYTTGNINIGYEGKFMKRIYKGKKHSNSVTKRPQV